MIPSYVFFLHFLHVSPFFSGMLSVFLLAGLILALSIPGTTSLSATLRFLGQTDFVVNESSDAVVRLVVERVGDPVSVTALILVGSLSELIHLWNHLFYFQFAKTDPYHKHVMWRGTSYCLALSNLCSVFSGGDIKDPVCVQKSSVSFLSSAWGLVSAAHSWCLERQAGHAAECGWLICYASW